MSATILSMPPRKPLRDPDLEEARARLHGCTLRVCSHPEGSTSRRLAEAQRGWWLAEVQRLNPGGAEIIDIRPLLQVRARI